MLQQNPTMGGLFALATLMPLLLAVAKRIESRRQRE
jgi:hypothetical protein